MKRFILYIVLFALCAVKANDCRANHLYASDLQYFALDSTHYIIRVTLFGDCSADADLFSSLDTSRPHVKIIKNSININNSFYLRLVDSGEVSPVCLKEINQTYCRSGTLPGVKKFVYQDTIQLTGPPGTNWRFVFDGNLGSSIGAGRSISITNISRGTLMQLEASFNNSAGPNSSPEYSAVPTPFYCKNIFQQYNSGAIDADGDSLVFKLVNGVDANTGGSVNYFTPYSGAHPLETTTGSFSFNPLNGQLAFTPSVLQSALVVYRVSEYRAGKLIGVSQREMTVIIRDNCESEIPQLSITSLTGASLTSGNILNICKGEKLINFDISIHNPDGDTTIVKPLAVPAGANLTVFNSNTPYPSAHFSWVTDTLKVGIYTFFIYVKNNHCPLSNTQTVAYTIKVSERPTIAATQVGNTDCIHQAAVRFDLAYGFLPRKVTIVNSSGAIVKVIIDSTGSDSLGILIDSLVAGNYTAIVSCDSACEASTSLTVTDSGNFFIANISKSLCVGDPIELLDITPIVPGAVLHWYNINGAPLSTAPTINTHSAGNYTWYFIETYKVCSSFPVYVNAVVHALPNGHILNEPHQLCYGDKVYLEATGGKTYTWLPEDIVRHDTGGDYATVLIPTTFIVKVTDEFGCSDTTGVTYTDIQPCCNFSYPNAFTPNNDGHNDGFKVITYGNMEFYDLAIYNRWGELVFRTGNPQKAWDGTFGGQPCELGTYYYYFKAQCLTGTREMHKGDITLIR